jgi:glycosyltransferase involved in cell wall biosynthesis
LRISNPKSRVVGLNTPDLEVPAVSVVVPAFERIGPLREAIRSVLSQSFVNFEIIVVDDGSRVPVEVALADFTDERLRFIRQSNRGASSARNRGIDAARGRFIVFLDSDDCLLPRFFESVLELAGTASHVVVAPTCVVNRGKDLTCIKPTKHLADGEMLATFMMCKGGFVSTSGLLTPAQLVRSVMFSEDASYGDDTDFLIRLQLAGGTFKMTTYPVVLISDESAHGRMSSMLPTEANLPWLDRLRGRIPEREYLAYYGWHVAKGNSRNRPMRAMWYYTRALANGSFSPVFALRVLAQIVLSERLYRAIVDLVLSAQKRTRKSQPPLTGK